MHLYEKHNRIADRKLWLGVAVCVAVLLLFVLALLQVTRRNRAREAELVENAVRRAAVTCYAVEGRYPESLAYLSENYGVEVDTARYSVRYEVFASNIMPSVFVTERGGAS